MKTSNKIIIGILFGIFAIILLFAVTFRINSHPFAWIAKNDIGTAVIIKTPVFVSDEIKNINLKKISRLTIDGLINITVKHDAKPQIKLITNGINAIKFYQMDHVLHIKGLKRSNIMVTLPKLKSIAVTGMSHLSLIGFQQSRFKLQVTGMSSVKGIKNRFKTLKLVCIGRSNIDFSKSLAINVHANVTGQSNVILNMHGGNLTGEVIGMSSIKYSGRVKNRNVTVVGLSDVSRID